ncbi:hypothetical protein COHA_005897 [Chlorella ohadii]|uniref:Uncharacterized protein n=1 Tax=Chlorella ohadii TaxID=2649997 RepID=A0AAD5H1E9_9CHLO|nr:hypothetical protein COHA_005897 [Chlorella ohadii]
MARATHPALLALALVLAAAAPLACRGAAAAANQSVTAVGPAVLTNCFSNAELFGFETSFAAEITNGLNYTQMGSFPTQNYTEDDFLAVPTDETKPWLSKTGATVYKANAEWMVIGQLLCTGGYPSPLPEGGDTTPPPGNITLVLTNQCSQYTYKPDASKPDSDSYYVLTDEWGTRYAQQGVENGLPQGEEAWAEFMAGVQLPPAGWKLERVPLTEEETHMVYLVRVGDACLLAIVIDNLGNRYHQLTYDVPFTEGLLGSMECPATGAVPSNVLDKLLAAPRAAA